MQADCCRQRCYGCTLPIQRSTWKSIAAQDSSRQLHATSTQSFNARATLTQPRLVKIIMHPAEARSPHQASAAQQRSRAPVGVLSARLLRTTLPPLRTAPQSAMATKSSREWRSTPAPPSVKSERGLPCCGLRARTAKVVQTMATAQRSVAHGVSPGQVPDRRAAACAVRSAGGAKPTMKSATSYSCLRERGGGGGVGALTVLKDPEDLQDAVPSPAIRRHAGWYGRQQGADARHAGHQTKHLCGAMLAESDIVGKGRALPEAVAERARDPARRQHI